MIDLEEYDTNLTKNEKKNPDIITCEVKFI